MPHPAYIAGRYTGRRFSGRRLNRGFVRILVDRRVRFFGGVRVLAGVVEGLLGVSVLVFVVGRLGVGRGPVRVPALRRGARARDLGELGGDSRRQVFAVVAGAHVSDRGLQLLGKLGVVPFGLRGHDPPRRLRPRKRARAAIGRGLHGSDRLCAQRRPLRLDHGRRRVGHELSRPARARRRGCRGGRGRAAV